MPHDTRLYLEDILEACEKIQRYTHAFSFPQFQQEDRTYDAVIRNLEIIGEASRKLPSDIQNR